MSPIVVDTDVASYIFKWHSSAQHYVNALRGSELILSYQLQSEIGGPGAPECIVQFATFTSRGGFVVPEFWHITNIPGLTATGYQPPSENIHCLRATSRLPSDERGHHAVEHSRTPSQSCSSVCAVLVSPRD